MSDEMIESEEQPAVEPGVLEKVIAFLREALGINTMAKVITSNVPKADGAYHEGAHSSAAPDAPYPEVLSGPVNTLRGRPGVIDREVGQP